MSANVNGQFRDDELVTRKMKVNGDWHIKTFPVVGGRLRIAHEANERLSILTEIVVHSDDVVVAKAKVETDKGRFSGTGTASAQRDARLADSLFELAETRAIARALRFGGFGVEYCGAEEVNHVPGNGDNDTTSSQQEPKQHNSGNGKATQSQVRALNTLSKKAKYGDEDLDSLLLPFKVNSFKDLSKESASQLISYLQTEVAH